MNEDIKDIIESLFFASETPLSVRRIAEILEREDLAAVQDAVRGLADEYDRRQGGFYLSEVAGGYQLRTRPEHRAWIQRMLQTGPARLSRAAMETLAIVAYKQPVLRSDVEHIRGVDCGGVLRALLERKIVKILGRKEMPGRPLLYGTTRKFLEMFNLRDLKDLPTPKEFAPDRSGTADAPLLNRETAENSPDEAPEAFEGPKEPSLESAGPNPPSPKSLHQKYLPMIIEADTPSSNTDQDSTPDADGAGKSDPDPVQSAGGGTPEKNT